MLVIVNARHRDLIFSNILFSLFLNLNQTRNMPRRLPNHIDLNNLVYSKRQHKIGESKKVDDANDNSNGKESKPSGRKKVRSGSINQEKHDESVLQANEELKIQMKTLELRIKDLETEAEKNSKENTALKLEKLGT